jgi:ubiquinone/menaquinone biosynthesis C-methylase UbiE
MNYGYAVNSDSGHTIRLAEEEESERFSYQLYHFMATGFKKLTNLNNLNVVEVGSGRGGGLAYIVRNLKPGSALGVDYSKQQVEFCKKTYKYDNINFVEGDAENLPIKDTSVDLVLNVESCHCYGNFSRFIEEVARVLKSGGIFMITDFMLAEEVERFEEVLKGKLEVVEKKDITENVLLSLQKDSSRRMELIMNRTPTVCRRVLKRFSGCEGSNIFQQLSSKQSLYLAYKLKKA